MKEDPQVGGGMELFRGQTIEPWSGPTRVIIRAAGALRKEIRPDGSAHTRLVVRLIEVGSNTIATIPFGARSRTRAGSGEWWRRASRRLCFRHEAWMEQNRSNVRDRVGNRVADRLQRMG